MSKSDWLIVVLVLLGDLFLIFLLATGVIRGFFSVVNLILSIKWGP